MSYDYVNQSITSSCLIQAHDNDSFYNPATNQHTGYAADGSYYVLGAVQLGHQPASWFTEAANPYRGDTAAFPQYGLVLLSPVSLVILDQGTAVATATQLPLWMQFLLSDTYALANNFNGSIQGFSPSALAYSDGVISVTYTPDAGNQATYTSGQHPLSSPYPPPYPTVSAQSHMVVSIDFATDSVYLDVAV